MTLTNELRKQKENTIKMVPKEVLGIMNNATEELASSDILTKALKKGAAAPDFTLPNIFGEPINLKNTLKNGPVILKFFRGDW